jgi:hypothetical protein
MGMDDDPKPKKKKKTEKNDVGVAIPKEEEIDNSTPFKGKPSLFFIMK